MAVYNNRPYVAQALESIHRQTYQHWELLVWDDGSTDGSEQVIAEWARRDPRIRLVGGKHCGAAGAMATLTAASEGPYLGWVDSDDWLAPGAVELTVAALEQHTACGVVYTDYFDTDPHGRVHQRGHRCQVPYSRDRLLIDFMTFHFRLIRRTVYEQVGGVDASLPSAEDYDLCLRLSEITDFHHLPQALYYYRNHAASASYARRLEQIEWSAEVIRRAMIRRGLADQWDLHVELIGRFRMARKAVKADRAAAPDTLAPTPFKNPPVLTVPEQGKAAVIPNQVNTVPPSIAPGVSTKAWTLGTATAWARRSL